LFHRQFARLRTFEDLVDIPRGTPVYIGLILSVAEQASSLRRFAKREDGWQAMLRCLGRDLACLLDEERKPGHDRTQQFQVLFTESKPKFESPVMLPRGCARLLTRPAATGSTPITTTIGIVVVASCAASAPGAPSARMTSAFNRTNS
jgi:hypothetical protein